MKPLNELKKALNNLEREKVNLNGYISDDHDDDIAGILLLLDIINNNNIYL